MKGFVAGLIVGGAMALIVPGFAAEVVGENGWLRRWTVLDTDGNEICSAPYARPALHQLVCEIER